MSRILITSGPTREPIDSVRFISNVSTGRTGAMLADELSQSGFEIDFLAGIGSQLPQNKNLRLFSFSSSEDLSEKMRNLLGDFNYQAVIHSAAVSDFSVEPEMRSQIPKKISSNEPLTLHLRPNPKIIASLRKWSQNPNTRIIGFKLTSHASEEEQQFALQKIFSLSKPDIIVHNDLKDRNEGRDYFGIYSSETVASLKSEKVGVPFRYQESAQTISELAAKLALTIRSQK